MKKMFRHTGYISPLLALIFLPSLVSASTIYIDTDRREFYEGDSIVLNVRVDSEGKDINTVEGNISLRYSPESISINNLSLSESDFSLWPQKPILSSDFKTISFSGGIPKGLKSRDAILFKIVLLLKESGLVTIAPNDLSVYLNDGKGTKDTTNSKNLTLSVLPQKTGSQSTDDWNKQISEDTTPPEPFEILMGREGSVFEGKKFLSWNTVDRDSGVSYYEVIEGDLPPVRSDKTYILREQDTPTKVTIIAYDVAGNARKSEYDPTSSKTFYIVMVLLVLLTLMRLSSAISKRKNASVQK